MDSRKKCVVTYRFYEGEFVGNWNACLGTAGLAQDLSNLHMDLNLIQLSSGEDRWSNLLDAAGKFIEGVHFISRAVQKRTPTVKALQERGVLIESSGCGSCISGFDCVDHILVHCPFAGEIRREIFKWCGMYQSMFNNLEDIISYGMIWNIWKYRNDRLFKSIFTSPSKGVDF
uniref:Reverse transcriptase zinc-binding domain-containing protein n=1 Tax=Lactuca sativa TaxID=4236 RepID=A0A9R1VM17_LACSA|nr:hypothetical protein LSAT_V11C500286140 [Lactuca sativa]